MPSLAGTRIDKYDMIEEVGHGGMAVVYRGLDRVLKREVAVKVLHPHLADREESRLRLQREAIAVAKLRHENILEIFDYSGAEAEESYIVTEFIHGMTLKQWVDDRLDPRPAVAALIVHRLCLALQHAHRTGIVHRDIKPENVMIREDGVLKLMDFGIAQIIDNQKLTLTGQLIGSPAYMAPELISGRPLDQRTDLFSLGILLYQLATGRLPFFGRNPHEVLNRIADGDYPPAATICPLVDRELEDIITLSLASDPDQRYQSVETFGQELERYLKDIEIEPTGVELRGYFCDAPTYVEELDKRVCEALLRRARAAADDGETARAIRLLGRVLELDATHPGAMSLLQQMQQRERRNRRLMIAAATLAALGLIVAVARLVPRGDPLDEGPGDTARHAANLDRMVPSGGTIAAAAGDDDLPDEAAATASTTGIEGALPTDDSTGPQPTPAPTGRATGLDAVAEPSDDDGGRRRPYRPPPSRAPITTACTLKIGGIPVSTAKHLKLKIGDQQQAITSRSMTVEFEGPAVQVELDDKRFVASRTLTREACEAGSVPVLIRSKAATISFVGAPPGLVVICRKGCRSDLLGKNQRVDKFQPVPLKPGEVQHVVELTYKHEDFHKKPVRETLLPGPNTVTVSLVPRDR